MKNTDVEMTFGEHIEELRRRVIYALLGLVVTTVLCGVFYKQLLIALLRPYAVATRTTEEPAPPPPPPPDTKPDAAATDTTTPPPAPSTEAAEAGKVTVGQPVPPRLILGGPLTGYVTIILLCVICGIILASPWILYQIWAFVGVGLHPHERRFVRTYGPFSFFLFVLGAATFYFVMLPVGLQALLSPTSDILVDGKLLIDPSFFLNDYFKFVALMTLITGIVFQTPLIVMFLARTEIVPLGTLVRKQRIVLMILVILSAVLTPQDPVTMVMMAIPLIFLYELGLLLAWISMRRRQRKQQQEAQEDEPWDEYEKQNEQPWQNPDAPAPASGAAEPPAPAPETTTSEPGAAEGPLPDPEEDPYAEQTRREQELYGHPPQTTEPPPPTTEPPKEAAPPASDDAPPPPDHGLPPEERMK